MNRLTLSLAAILLLGALPLAQAAVITTEVTAEVNGFWPGPFSSGDPITISYDWDTSAVQDSGNAGYLSTFDLGATNFSLSIGGWAMSGTAQVKQRNNTTDDQIEIQIGTYLGTSYGSIDNAPDYGLYNFEYLYLRFVSSNQLFTTPTATETLISNPMDMVVNNITINFDDDANPATSSSSLNLLNPTNRAFTMSAATSVPGPAPLALLAFGAVALRRCVRKN